MTNYKNAVAPALFLLVVILCLGSPAWASRMTSLTLDPETASGTTTGAPGAFSTNTADPLMQIGVMIGGVFVNTPGPGFDLGEISIALQPGTTTLDLFANGLYPANLFYGAVLFFDGGLSPQIAVYNANGGSGGFSVQPAGATIIGSANGGNFFVAAPGTSLYTLPDGSTIEVLSFTINSLDGRVDNVGYVNIGPDGIPDTTAHLTLRYSPVPEPSALILFGSGLAGVGAFAWSRRKR